MSVRRTRSDAGAEPTRPPGEAGAAAIVAQGLTKGYVKARPDLLALRGVDLSVPVGEMVAVMGPSGCGKSTLLHLLGGLDTPDAGTVTLAGERVENLGEARRALLRRRRVGYVFQFFNLVANLSVADNVELPLLLAGRGASEAQRRRTELLERLGLAEHAAKAPRQLSGGQQQRVALARALANRPDVLLADEPTGALDSAAARDVLALLADEHRAGQTTVLVTHDPGVALAADRVLVMRDGRIHAEVRPAERAVTLAELVDLVEGDGAAAPGSAGGDAPAPGER